MRIIEEAESCSFLTWAENHAVEIGEVEAFINSKAHRAELDINRKYSMSSQRENYKRAFRKFCRDGKWMDYKVSLISGKIIVVWLKYTQDKEKEDEQK